jgi:hypothetical protein
MKRNIELNEIYFLIFTDLIDDITDHTDRTGHRLIKETRHIRIVDRKSATCCKYLPVYMIHRKHKFKPYPA